jgi:choline dehydrogenase-like flavoprotein
MFKIQQIGMALAPVVKPEEVASKHYDVVIVGSGISGAILAYELSCKNYRVLIVEAGPGQDLSQHGYQGYLETFYSAVAKDNNAPFKPNPNAEMPRSPTLKKLQPGQTNPNAYFIQHGPYVSDSNYTRVLGGTTVHWEAKAIRMLREDFQTKTKFGQGLDWPIGLDELMPYYERAEFVMGVSGDVESQKRLGAEFRENYVYPMVELRASYLDQTVAKLTKGMVEHVEGEDIPIEWVTFPQAKNADPNPKYGEGIDLPFLGKNSLPFKPTGAIRTYQGPDGERCQGNTNCVPLCPVQARFDARKVLVNALGTGKVDILNQAVASQVLFDDNNNVTGIKVKRYERRDSTVYTTITVTGTKFILAANAVENARLMLASDVLNKNEHKKPMNDLIGRHLMDHPYLLCWGLLPEDEKAGVGRGPSCTSGLCNFRKGAFRYKFAPFASDIHNDGWGWATGSPTKDLIDVVDDENLYGRALREELNKRLMGQLLLAHMIELPADPDSRVTVDENYKDQLGNMKPVVRMKLSDYSMKAAEYCKELSDRIFANIKGSKNCTEYGTGDYGYVEYNGKPYAIRGGNHLAGTHVMGTCSSNSVVDVNQKTWDHPNLYMVGAGSMPSIGSSNTTLTIAALCYKTAEAILKELGSVNDNFKPAPQC